MGEFTRDEIEAAWAEYQKRGVQEHDWPGWADMFTDDARYEEHNLGVFEGRSAITALHRRHHEGVPGDDPLDRVVDHRR